MKSNFPKRSAHVNKPSNHHLYSIQHTDIWECKNLKYCINGRKKNVVIYICAHNFFFFDKRVHTNCTIQSNVLYSSTCWNKRGEENIITPLCMLFSSWDINCLSKCWEKNKWERVLYSKKVLTRTHQLLLLPNFSSIKYWKLYVYEEQPSSLLKVL